MGRDRDSSKRTVAQSTLLDFARSLARGDREIVISRSISDSQVVCLHVGVRDEASETLLTEVKGVPETTDLGKSSIEDVSKAPRIDEDCNVLFPVGFIRQVLTDVEKTWNI